MFFTSVLGFSNVSRGIFYMGQSSILFYVFTGFSFFLPYSIICAEMGASFKSEKGGIFSWIEKSVGGSFGRKLGFITIFMWWFSYVVWMMNVASMITIPLSYAMSPFIDGGFSHATSLVKEALGPIGMGVIGMIVISFVTYLITLGVTKLAKLASIGGIAVMSLNVILLVCAFIILAAHGFHPASSYSWADMTTVPKFSKYAGDGITGLVGLFGFAVYAIFAYGGVEAVGGLVDKLENPERNVKRGLLIGAGVGIFVYCFGIFAATWFIDRNSPQVLHDVMKTSQGGTGLFYAGNAVYYFMYTLGATLASSLGAAASTCNTMGNVFAAYTGVSMFCALTGAFFVLIYAPLKQMIEGVPQGIFPASWSKENQNGMPTVALRWQLGLVIVLIALGTFGGDAVADLIQNLVTLTNVTMTVPVIFIIYAYIHYLRNDAVEKPIRIFRSNGSGIFMAWCAMLTIGFANLFTVASPLYHAYLGEDVGANMKEGMMSIIGVVVFALIGWFMVARYERHVAQGKLPMPEAKAELGGK
ncbi:glutamate/gamma-aminobutyrate family transporter YjeM [Paludibacterium sp. B53371]|nr:glutamate/gamma-aminobutyrate family transporter YjeM [Paludibacterium sp. THUN1379]